MSKSQKLCPNTTEKLLGGLELPKDLILGIPYMQCYGNLEIIIENFRGILGISTCEIEVSSKNGRILICGKNLSVCAIRDRYLKVNGHIAKIEFLT